VKKFIVILVFLFYVSVVSASQNWWNFGNVGYNEGNTFPYFGSSIPSNHNLSNPRSCEVVLPLKYSPVVGDLNNDGINEIVVLTSGNEFRLYDFDCNFLTSFDLGQNSLAMPVIRNINGDVNLDVLVLGEVNLTAYTFASDLNVSVIGAVKTNSSVEFGLACDVISGVDVCLSFENPNKLHRYNVDAFTHINYSQALPNTQEFREFVSSLDGLASAKFSSGTLYEVAVGLAPDNAGIAGAFTFSLAGNKKIDCNSSAGTLVFTSNSLVTTGLAKLGIGAQSNVLLENIRVSTNKDYAFICDVSGNTARVKILNQSSWIYSNWAVADFNLDGGNEACIQFYNTTDNFNHLVCYNSGYAAVLDKPMSKHPSSISLGLAEFDTTNPYMEAVNSYGIFSFNGTEWLTLFNITAYPLSFDGRVQIVERDTSRTNWVIYGESTKLLIFGYGSYTAVTCGNLICDGAENPITCAVDCLGNATIGFIPGLASGEACANSSSCASQKCLYGYCSLKDAGENCHSPTECLSVVCLDGKCTKPSLWQSVEAGKDGVFGDDEKTNNFLSLATIVVVCGSVMVAGGIPGIVGGIVLSLLMSAFFAYVGWLSAWFFVVEMLGLIALATIMMFIRAGK